MKRKFGLGLAPLKILSKPAAPKPQEPPRLPVPEEWIQYSPPDSPVIQRRAPLDPRTELELRKACAVILQDFKPSDSGIEPALRAREILRVDDADRYPAIKPTWVTDSNAPSASNPLSGQPIVPSHEASRELNRSRTGFRSDATLKDHFANDLFSNDIVHPSLKTVAKRPQLVRAETYEENTLAPAPTNVSLQRDQISPPRKATIEQASSPSRGVNSHVSSASTEGSYYTGSTDWPRSASTTFTSPSVNSMRFSDQVYSELNPAKESNGVAERPKADVESRRRGKGSEDFSWKPFDSKCHTSKLSDVATSKASTIVVTNPIENKQNSGAPAQIPVLRTELGTQPVDTSAATSPSRRAWHSWGFRRHAQNNQGPPTQPSADEANATTDMNLNRTLPPLPSIDNYKSEDNHPKEVLSSTPPATTHIATMLKSGEPRARIATPKLVEVSRLSDGFQSSKARPISRDIVETPPIAEARKYFVEPATNVIRSRPDTANSKKPPSILKATAPSVQDANTIRSPTSLSRDVTSSQTNSVKDFTMPSFSRPHPRSKPESRLSNDAFDFDQLMSAMREGIKTPKEVDNQSTTLTNTSNTARRDVPAFSNSSDKQPAHNNMPSLARPSAGPAASTSFLDASSPTNLSSHSSSTSTTSTATALPATPTAHSHPLPQPLYPATSTPSPYRHRGLRKVLSSLHRDHSSNSHSRNKVWVPPPTPNRGAWGPARSVTSLDKWGVDEHGADVYASGPGPVMGGGGGSLKGGWADYVLVEGEEEACAAPVIRF